MRRREFIALVGGTAGARSLPTHSWREGQFERLRSWRGGDDFPIHLKPMN